MAQPSAERIPGAQPVDDIHLNRRCLKYSIGRAAKHALRPPFDHRQLDAELEQRGGRPDGISSADRHLGLLLVAYCDGSMWERLSCPVAGLLR